MTTTISKKFTWQMGHALSAPYVGKCTRLHGHEWEVEFSYTGPLDERGMVLDFSEFKKMKDWIDENFDHRFLVKENHLILEPYFEGPGEWSNDIDVLGLVPMDINPTSENLAKALHDVCVRMLNLDSKNLVVKIKETCTSSATYRED